MNDPELVIVPLTRTSREYLDSVEHDVLSRRFDSGVKLSHAPDGHPVLDNGWQISISHCKTALAILLWNDSRACGVDMEMSRPRQLRHVATRFLSEREQLVYDTDLLRLIAWTAKEAAFKASLDPSVGWLDIRLPLSPINLGEQYAVYVKNREYRAISLRKPSFVITTVTSG